MKRKVVLAAVIMVALASGFMVLFGGIEVIRTWNMDKLVDSLGPNDVATVPYLISRLDDYNPVIRKEAIRGLSRIGPGAKDATPGLLKALNDTSPETRSEAAMALGSIKAAAAVPALIELLNDPEIEVRFYAAAGLREIGPPAAPAVPALTKLLQDNQMGYMAAYALAAIGAPAKSSVPDIVAAMRKATDWRSSYIAALGQFGPLAADAVPDLQALAKGSDPMAKAWATKALAAINPPAPKVDESPLGKK